MKQSSSGLKLKNVKCLGGGGNSDLPKSCRKFTYMVSKSDTNLMATQVVFG